MKPLPSFRPPPLPTIVPAPFILVTLHAQHFELDRAGLEKELENLTGSTISTDVAIWKIFTEENLLTVEGWAMLAKPTGWIAGAGKWFAFVFTGAKGEVHIYSGWSAPDGQAPSHSHLELIRDSSNWMHRIVNAGTPKWRRRIWPITCGGSASLAGREAGMRVVSRQSFLRSVTDKDAATAFGVLLLTIVGMLAKGGDFSLKAVLVGILALLGLSLLHTSVRHFLVLDRYRWTIDGLEK